MYHLEHCPASKGLAETEAGGLYVCASWGVFLSLPSIKPLQIDTCLAFVKVEKTP